MESQAKIEELIQDRDKFDKCIYTPLHEAVEELKRRHKDKQLEEAVSQYLDGDIPAPLATGLKLVIFRHICSPNYEFHRLVSAADSYGLEPLLGEYSGDIFTPKNLNKYHLGRMEFHFGFGKNGGHKSEHLNVIDFNCSNGKLLSEIKTVWGEPLVDFHHKLLRDKYPKLSDAENFFDSSLWFKKHGGVASQYYKKFIALFMRHGILFENFILEEEEELSFAKEVFLPAFFSVWDKFGIKPLIVALTPTDIEGDIFWLSYPGAVMGDVEKHF
jgi:hypothetical protein